jgi:hypothetical protein
LNVLAGALALAFGVLHGAPAVRGSREVTAIPMWARSLWLALSLLSIAGGVLLIVADDISGAAIGALGCIGLWLLAIANGFWIHGRPNPVHHIVRGAVVAAIVVLAFAAAS